MNIIPKPNTKDTEMKHRTAEQILVDHKLEMAGENYNSDNDILLLLKEMEQQYTPTNKVEDNGKSKEWNEGYMACLLDDKKEEQLVSEILSSTQEKQPDDYSCPKCGKLEMDCCLEKQPEREIKELISAIDMIHEDLDYSNETGIDNAGIRKVTSDAVRKLHLKYIDVDTTPSTENRQQITEGKEVEFAEWIVKNGIKDSASEGMWLIMQEGSDVDIKQRISSTDLYTLFISETK